MKVTNISSGKLVNINSNKYAIDWENDGNSSLEIKFRNLIYPYWKSQIILFQPIVPGSKLKLDFLNINKKLCVEIDGSQHDKYNKYFHNNSRNNWLASLNRDRRKELWLEENNIKLLRLIEEDLNYFSPQYIKKKFNINII